MKKLLFMMAMLCTVSLLGGYITKENIPYYDSDFPKGGNKDYLEERCKLDLYYPDDVKDFSTVVIFHGGGLIRGNKTIYATLKDQGFAVAAVNYRLSGKRAKCPDYIEDAAAAVAWVLRHIKEYGGSEKRVFVSGHSAGGYLSAMIALDPRYLEKFGTSPKNLAGVLPSSGQMTTHFQVLKEYRKQGKETPKVVIDQYAPMSYITKDAPPLLFVVGDNETEIPGRVGENFMIQSLLVEAKHPNCRIFQQPGFSHGAVWWPATFQLRYWIKYFERREKRLKKNKKK